MSSYIILAIACTYGSVLLIFGGSVPEAQPLDLGVKCVKSGNDSVCFKSKREHNALSATYISVE